MLIVWVAKALVPQPLVLIQVGVIIKDDTSRSWCSQWKQELVEAVDWVARASHVDLGRFGLMHHEAMLCT
jgi:hypothetical protein